MPFKSLAPIPVSHASFYDLSAAGYDVRIIDDRASMPEHEKASLRDLPIHWKRPQPVLKPKVAMLRDAIVFRDGSALLPDGCYCHFDTIFSSEEWRKSESHRRLCSIDPSTEGALVRPNMPGMEVSGSCFSLRGTNLRNFGHFVHDILSKIYYEDLGVIKPERDRVIAPRMPLPMQEALFRKVFENYEIVKVPPKATLKVEKLLLLANLCSHEMFNPAAIAALAKRMRRIMKRYAGKKKSKVCVSRRDGRLRVGKRSPQPDGSGRNFTNEDIYENRMRELDFRVVKVSELEPESQFALWANTADIVGIHGAGMMNSLFMQPGANYTEITGAPANHILHYTARCAMIVGHNVKGLTGDIDRDGNAVINLDHLEEILK